MNSRGWSTNELSYAFGLTAERTKRNGGGRDLLDVEGKGSLRPTVECGRFE